MCIIMYEEDFLMQLNFVFTILCIYCHEILGVI